MGLFVRRMNQRVFVYWHGATKDNWFSQVVIYDSTWKLTEASDDSDNSVSDEYYNGLDMVEYAHQRAIDSLMFAALDTTMTLPTFRTTTVRGYAAAIFLGFL